MINETIYLSHYKDKSIYESNVVEFWKPITDTEISNVIPNRYYISSKGNTYNSNTQKEIGYSIHTKGTRQITVTTKNESNESKLVTIKVPTIVMKLFAPLKNDTNKYNVVHKDGNKLHDDLSNLEYCTNSENAHISLINGHKSVFGNTINNTLDDNDLDLKYLSYEKYIK